MTLGDAERICVTTYDAAGVPTKSSEFVVPLGDDRVGIWTPHSSPWVDRLSLSQVVSVQAANGVGKALRTEPVFEGRAELVHEGDDFALCRTRTQEKYGFRAKLTDAVDWAWEIGGKRTPAGVIVIHVVG